MQDLAARSYDTQAQQPCKFTPVTPRVLLSLRQNLRVGSWHVGNKEEEENWGERKAQKAFSVVGGASSSSEQPLCLDGAKIMQLPCLHHIKGVLEDLSGLRGGRPSSLLSTF